MSELDSLRTYDTEEDAKEEIKIIDKDISFSTERFGYHMFRIIGVIMMAIGMIRAFLGVSQIGANWNFGFANFILEFIGGVFLFGTTYWLLHDKPTDEDEKFMHEREENQLKWESSTHGFEHNLQKAVSRNEKEER